MPEHPQPQHPRSQQPPAQHPPAQVPGSRPGSDEPQGVSRRQALAVGGGLAAAAAVGGVAAAGPAGAAQAAAHQEPLTVATLSLAQARAVLAAAEREARRIGVPMYIQVVDVCGDEKASSRQDGNGRASLSLVPPKTQTALAFRTPTVTLAQRTTDPVRVQSFIAAGFTLLGGGVPITADGQVIGAIGVGGGSPEQDHQVALAGVAVLAS